MPPTLLSGARGKRDVALHEQLDAVTLRRARCKACYSAWLTQCVNIGISEGLIRKAAEAKYRSQTRPN